MQNETEEGGKEREKEDISKSLKSNTNNVECTHKKTDLINLN
jgi:hypothetical protein